MGRKATKKSLRNKILAPVPLPHDGPIHQLYVQSAEETKEGSNEQDQDVLLALDLLLGHLHEDYEKKDKGLSWSNLALDLVRELQGAKTSKDQLQAMQSFKSTVLNLKKKQERPSEIVAIERGDSTPIEGVEMTMSLDGDSISSMEKAGQLPRGLFRLFLEWSLSAQTPVPLQRAIQSNLNILVSEASNVSLFCMASSSPSSTPSTFFFEPHEIAVKTLRSIFQGAFSTSRIGSHCHDLDVDSRREKEKISSWANPLHCLDVAANYSFLTSFLQTILWDDCLLFLYDSYVAPILMECRQETNTAVKTIEGESDEVKEFRINQMKMVGEGLVIVGFLKQLLSRSISDNNSSTNLHRRVIPHNDQFRQYFLELLACPNMPLEGFNTLGIVYARFCFWEAQSAPRSSNTETEEAHLSETAKAAIQTVWRLNDRGKKNKIDDRLIPLTTSISRLPPLARLSIVQGIAATLDSKTLTKPVQIFLIEQHSDIPHSCGDGNSSTNDGCEPNEFDRNVTASSAMEVCWRYCLRESQVASDPIVRWAALKGLSTLASRWRQQQDKESTTTSRSENVRLLQSARHTALIQETLQVVLQAWENPPLRKLGTAIPGIFRTLVQLLSEDEVQELCRAVLAQPINRKGRYLALEILLPYFTHNNQGIIQETKTLLEGIGDRGPNSGAIADLWVKILLHTWQQVLSSKTSNQDNCFDHWTGSWVPPLARAMVTGEFSRRKQVTAFCLPRLFDLIKGTQSLKEKMSECIILLFNAISIIQMELPLNSTSDKQTQKKQVYHVNERTLWAYLELSRQIQLQKLMTTEVKATIASHLPERLLHSALTHSSHALRLSAFQALEAVVSESYGHGIEGETKMWKYALPFSIKAAESKEYTSSILQHLTIFLDRLSLSEVRGEGDRAGLLPKLCDFVTAFLVGDLFLKKGAYPGTVCDKESFSLMLLESILTFLLQDQSYSDDNCVSRNGAIFSRTRRPSEKATMLVALKALVSQEVFASLFALLQSVWDSTRLIGFRFLSKIVLAAQANQLAIPDAYIGEGGISGLTRRGLYLASSPRQREADTGARILAFAYMFRRTAENRKLFMMELLKILETRLSEMKHYLYDLMDVSARVSKTQFSAHSNSFPLGHGIVHALLLSVQHEKILIDSGMCKTEHFIFQDLYESMIAFFCEAIQLSLNVVADVREGEFVDGMDDMLAPKRRGEQVGIAMPLSTPLNVNTGAIGANGAFSKLQKVDKDELNGRIANQRVIIGTWLLTKQTCAAISACIGTSGFRVPQMLVHKCGTLLISTLTSLKHAGAAFAARDSLQEISSTCLSSPRMELRTLPQKWASRLLDEISSAEKVRDSTLRRSTGFALGILAIMRSERASTDQTQNLCSHLLKSLVEHSLPTREEALDAFSKLSIQEIESEEDATKLFYASTGNSKSFFQRDSSYQVRSRVHALNILRMIILDAPLANAVRPFIGDAMISALLGYNDPLWVVRNSATMVFSAAMLRVVDADKNASNTDRTSSQAITITELFRRYPALSQFLPAMMKLCLTVQDVELNSQLFPILLLLSRIQPISNSGGLAASISHPYPAMVFEALGNKNHATRASAARALANMCCEDKTSSASSKTFLHRCDVILKESLGKGDHDMNLLDGVLLAIDALLSASASSRALFVSSQMYTSLLCLSTRTDNDRIRHPPPCIAAALNILAKSMDEIHNHSFSNEVVSSCLSIVQDSKIERIVGGALLYESCARMLIKILESRLWESSEIDEIERSLNLLQGLLTSSIIDVRLVSTKAFKKTIYANIDSLLAARKNASHSSTRLTMISTTILDCLKVELQRGDKESQILGGHIPTVRRLSRCLLECFYGFQKLSNGTNDRSMNVFCVGGNSNLWSVATEMMETEKFLDESKIFAPHGETYLSANAIEMMSIVLSNTYLDGKSPSESHLGSFYVAASRLINPHASWRCRYSAVVAIKTCGVLKHDKKTPKLHCFHRIILELLQDSDSDVRKCAAQAATQILVGSAQEQYVSLPVLALCEVYPFVHRMNLRKDSISDSLRGVNDLLNIILTNCEDLDSSLTTLDRELSESRNASNIASESSNSSTTRRIFEEEDPNAFQERMVSNQLATKTLLSQMAVEWENSGINLADGFSPKMPHNGPFGKISNVLMVSLELIHQRENEGGGIMHELTRFPSIFPSLHGLICATAALVNIGFCNAMAKIEKSSGTGADKFAPNSISEKVEALQNLAKAITAGNISRQHPEIHASLCCLATAKSGDQRTKNELMGRCLFLV